MMMGGTRARVRQRKKIVDGIKEWTGCNIIEEVKRLAEDEARLRSIVANVNLDSALR